MKRKLAGLLCVCMLFSGCGNGSSQPLQTESPTVESLPTQIHLPLLEQGTTLEESSNLRYIPNAAVESMTAPEVRLLGNGLLLLSDGRRGLDGSTENNRHAFADTT